MLSYAVAIMVFFYSEMVAVGFFNAVVSVHVQPH